MFDAMNLVLVESPTKARTLSKYLGNEYVVEATYGHIRDLPESKLGIDVEKGFKPDYVQTSKQKERLGEIKKLFEKAENVYLATDPDREGEAIAWHVAQLLGKSKKEFRRIVFHEITEKAIKQAVGEPRKIDLPLVDAQQARRILDRLVGYKLSPLLWKKVRKGLSAGRVQSVAVRLVVEREREIEAFKPHEYWTIEAEVLGAAKFWITLVEKDGEKIEVNDGDVAASVKKDLEKSEYKVLSVEKKDFKRTPPAPFTTSTLQQNAANKMGWSAKKTMQVAQNLYEEGHITYHRTDSTNMAEEAVKMARVYAMNTFGKEYGLVEPRLYKTKNKVAQEAHEAIRPTDVSKQVVGGDTLNRDQQRLYELIWKRFLATQMTEVRGQSVKVRVTAKNGATYVLEAKGETITFDGWSRLYEKKDAVEKETDPDAEATTSKILPEMSEGDSLSLMGIETTQKFTQPPARYNDAGLIKTLEEMGIGRPSTYAPILTTIQDRQYVERVEKRFKPTPLGVAVNDFLVTNFPGIVDYQFTANMEDQLDEIANGEKEWTPVLSDFYTPFEKSLTSVSETAERVKVEVETTGDKCPICKEGDVVVRIGKFGRFLACSRYPECNYKANYQNKIGVPCPKCSGDVILRKTRSGKSFYGCANYPKCDYASWTKPVLAVTEPVKTT